MKKILFTGFFVILFFIFSQTYSVHAEDVVLLTSKMKIEKAIGSYEGARDVIVQLIKENATEDSASKTPTTIGITYVIHKNNHDPVYKHYRININDTNTWYDAGCITHTAINRDLNFEIKFFDRRSCYSNSDYTLAMEVSEILKNKSYLGYMFLVGKPN